MSICRFGRLLASASVVSLVDLTSTLDGKVIGQEIETRQTPNYSAPCVQDPSGGAGVINQCFETPDGKLVVFYRTDFFEVQPAPRRYRQLIRTACEALEIEAEDCDVVPMLVNIGHNAMAGACEGRRVVLFDRNIDSQFGKPGAAFAILHELGHHHCDHLDQVCGPWAELEADAFAGAGLRVLGVSLNDALSVSRNLIDHDGGSHPKIKERADAIRRGWTSPKAATDCGLSTSN
ncbi:hypothetical protein CLV78_11544 [Aliiruegeria haliotis]|uniref:Peptidase M48-like protein n=1 Tax=Aliiruegeria haliotis TaxID=1280846 RepID=A0A2T0RG07_9RHOB|nr:hypothetical protein [Aliiruegeria haliotis]PRY20095.1 hypothetical protein CLV78_11544 [Aliiruegeria haliotis]